MSESTLGAQLKRDHAEAVALELRLNAMECTKIAGGLMALGPKWDDLRERIQQWAGALTKGEREIRRLIEPAPQQGADQ
jgi:hypothetical protein